jgi:ribosomal protein L12E/L44/L45/RPP1/RPP2
VVPLSYASGQAVPSAPSTPSAPAAPEHEEPDDDEEEPEDTDEEEPGGEQSYEEMVREFDSYLRSSSNAQ